MDFYKIKERTGKNGIIEVYPDFKVCRSKDLMVRGKSFYAIWDDKENLWSTDEYDVQRLIDEDLYRYAEEVKAKNIGVVQVKALSDFSSNAWLQFRNYVGHLSDSSHQLDENLTFSNTEVKKNDYVSRKLSYPLQAGDISAYDELIGTLYETSERRKLEWAVGAIISGDAKHIQKFVVLYGAAGAGKSTFLNILQKLFAGYYTTFEAKALTSNSNAFSTEVFKSNPLVAIQHDGDLSRIEDNTKLNSIVSHEEMTMNEKYKPSYMSRINSFLFMGTNKPVKITDAKSGLIRRLIDVQPSGERVSPRKYQALYSQIDFELGAIAHHCLEVYRELGRDYYVGYRPVEMMLQTDVFYNFIEDSYDTFKTQDGVTLNQAYEMYKQFCDTTLVDFKLPRYKFREEIKNYFHNFEERAIVDGLRVRSWYSGFITDHLTVQMKEEEPLPLIMEEYESIFDTDCSNQPAQYATPNETPIKRWAEVDTKLSDIDTTKLHYVKPPLNHIVIDFDLKGEDGDKSIELNLEAASKWPKTYAEFSKGGSGVHLHYIYDGDPTELSRVYSDGIEIKVFTGDSSLRRRLSKCNNIPVSTISSGLPLKEKKMINTESVKSEKSIRELIERNLNKEIHPGTKPSMDFIYKILEDAYTSGMQYDVSDLKPKILAFANNSSNQAQYCVKLLTKMRFESEKKDPVEIDTKDDRLVFFDVEVFPNLFIVCWKYEDTDTVVRMINPTPNDIEDLLKYKLVGFNCRRYDNHILYGRYMGYTNEQLYKLSQKIISNAPSALFGEAYDLSYADIYDYSSKKQGLKKFQIELGIHHKELGMPWDQDVPEDKWQLVAEYCDNDVISTEVVHKARIQDFAARQILAKLSGLSVNSTTQQHTAKIIFGANRNPQDEFIYTDLSDMFPGYTYDMGVSTYKGEITGEGGYVYAEPGMYSNVAVLDVASMHPTSIEQLDLFGPYTKNFSALKAARIAIKRKDYETAKGMLGGILTPYLESTDDAEALSYALKIVINIVYGLTSAKFPNAFRDPRNVDNIVAKRGALFMIDLKQMVQERGYKVIHIKTDSIKIPDADKEIIDLIMEFGMQYGYEFEHEVTYDKFCLVNDAVYIAKAKDGKKPSYWDAVGAQFQHPYVFKKLFSKEPIEFKDLCEAKTVTTALYLDLNGVETPMALTDPMHFVGKAGLFTPIMENRGGGLLVREKDGKYYAAVGTKGYRWLESEMVEAFNKQDDVDMAYFDELVNDAVENISKYGDFEWFTS
jgi:energy-coupling factor transporter ATP-binding protein EcfA2